MVAHDHSRRSQPHPGLASQDSLTGVTLVEGTQAAWWVPGRVLFPLALFPFILAVWVVLGQLGTHQHGCKYKSPCLY